MKITEDIKTRTSEFWRRNQVLFLHLPALLLFLVGTYAVLRSWDARIGVEGFGDLFGYALNGVRGALILFTAWWMKRWCFFDLHRSTEKVLFEAASTGDRGAFWRTVLDRGEWVIALTFATYWYTR